MTSHSPPPRPHLFPEPIEISSRSSKRPHPESSDRILPPDNNGQAQIMPANKPRRILPQPVEETSRSSRRKREHETTHTPADKSDQNESAVAGAKPARRRFAPEPVETTVRTSRRKFAPEPVEVSSRNSKDKANDDKGTAADKPRRRFAPEPVETTTTRRRRRRKSTESEDSPPESSSETSSKVSSRKSSTGRKFAPELIETAKGQFRQGKKEHTLNSPRKPPSPQKSHTSDSLDPPESRFSAAALAKKHYEERRRHSYCVPNLPMIESDSSGEDSPEPEPKTGEVSTDGETSKLDDIAEAESSSYMDYVYSLAEQRKLQEQAMAAYINEVPHEPFSHFAVEDDDDDDPHGVLSGKEGADPRTFRRSSQDELDLEMSNMRKHHAQLEKAKRELAQDTAGVSRFSAAALAARHHLNLNQSKSPKIEPAKSKKGPKDDTGEMAKMRAAASPPMAGADIVFPYTVSPRMTRCDVDQPPRPRRADSDDEPKVLNTTPSLWSASVTVTTKGTAGLWNGMCQKGPEDNTRPPTPIKSGLQTPAFEGPNPFDMLAKSVTKSPSKVPAPQLWNGLHPRSMTPARTPEPSDEFIDSIDKKLQIEQQIDEEFPNKVITQIYNYLSLGYPSLARPFDDELSKISRISVEELRKDDTTAKNNAKGYVGAPESEGSWQEDAQGVVQGCRRWEALRLYIREWARQSPNFANEMASRPCAERSIGGLRRNEAWGATVRKGSWAQ